MPPALCISQTENFVTLILIFLSVCCWGRETFTCGMHLDFYQIDTWVQNLSKKSGHCFFLLLKINELLEFLPLHNFLKDKKKQNKTKVL